MRVHQWRLLIVAAVMVAACFGDGRSTVAVAPGNAHFQRTWARTDQPVASNQVARTWMWGPDAFTGVIDEAYAESPAGQRQVQYFDKSRMEITDPGGDTTSLWYVTNGLLATELVTGRVQLGDSTFEQWMPAQVNVAGDADDPDGPTYATFASLLDVGAGFRVDPIKTGVRRDGSVYIDDRFAGYDIGAAVFASETSHWIAEPFWTFMNASGLVLEDDTLVTDALFEHPYYATGYPLTDPFWAVVRVGGVPQDVLTQVFQRRVLTYTPHNAPEWRVEAGNVGRHYHTWRYTQTPQGHGVVFEREVDGQWDLWRMNADGSDQQPLLATPDVDDEPTWSPDGRQIAFVRWTTFGTDGDIWVMNADGSQPHPLTTGTSLNYLPSWSPDGTRIAFISDRDGPTDVWTMNVDGSGARNLTMDGAEDFSPDWSPDSTAIVFTSDRAGSFDLWVMADTGVSATQLTHDVEDAFNAVWSPDGQRIAFQAPIDADSAALFVIRPDGSGRKQWTFPNADQTDVLPAWSPDGSQLVYTSRHDGRWDIARMDEFGLHVHLLTDNDLDELNPDWSPVTP